MGRATYFVEVSFTSNPLDTAPVWTRIPDEAIETISLIKRGRTRVLDRIEAGTLTLRLRNQDLAFSTNYPGSPYYPNFKARRLIRVGVTNIPIIGGTKYLFTGFIEQALPVDEGRGRFVDVRAVDAFKYLATRFFDINRGQEYSNWRIEYVLGLVGWPASLKEIYGGQTLVDGVNLEKVSALQHIQDVATTENGTFFIDGRGYPIFYGRHWRLTNAASTTIQATFSNAVVSGELPMKRFQPANDDTLFANHIGVTVGGEEVATADDGASQAANLRTDFSHEMPLLVSDVEAQSAAYWILKQRNTLDFRVESITLDGDASDAVLVQILSRGISDRIRMKLYPFNNPALTPWVKEHYIESITYNLSREDPLVTWTLSDAETSNFFKFSNAVFGRFNRNVFAY